MAMTIDPGRGNLDHRAVASRRRYDAAYKLEILAEYDTLDRDGKGALLRREVLYTSLISEWRKQRESGRDRGARRETRPAASRSRRTREQPAASPGGAPGRRPDPGPNRDRGAGKSLGAVGGVRHRQRRDQGRRDEMIEGAIHELTPVVGTAAACAAEGAPARRITAGTARIRRSPNPPCARHTPSRTGHWRRTPWCTDVGCATARPTPPALSGHRGWG